MERSVGKFPVNRFTVFLILLLSALAAYAPALSAPFTVLDDYYSIVENPQLRSATGFSEVFGSSFFPERAYYRPLVAAVFLLDYRLFGLNPFYFHLTNLLLHIFNAFLVFLLIEMLTYRRGLALLTAAFFLLHPVNSEAVNFVAGLSNLMSTFFCLITFILFGISFRKKTKGESIYVIPAGAAFILALLSKESSAMLPAVMAAHVYFSLRRTVNPWTALASAIQKIAPFLLILVGYFLLRHQMDLVGFWKPRPPQMVALSFVSFLSGVLEYVRLLLVPVDLYFDRSRELYSSWTNPGVWGSLFAVAALATLVWKNRTRLTPESLFYLFWFTIFLLPVSQLVMDIGVSPGQISVAEHFLYLPSVGIFAFLSSGILQVNARRLVHRNIFSVALIGYGFFLFVMTLSQSTLAQHPVAVYQESVQQNPRNGRVLYCLGVELAFQKRFVEAEHSFRRSIEADPYQPVARVGLGKALSDQGRYWEALDEYERVKDAGRFQDILSNNHAKLLQTILERFLSRLPTEDNNARLHYSIGTVYFKMNNLSAARDSYEKAVGLEPALPEALYNLGVVSEALGDREAAAGALQKMLSLSSADPVLTQHARDRLAALTRMKN